MVVLFNTDIHKLLILAFKVGKRTGFNYWIRSDLENCDKTKCYLAVYTMHITE
jgi:hypothetical protein